MIIIFDLDGTLFQTKYCNISAINHLFDEFGLKRLDEQYIVGNIGKKTDDFLLSIFPTYISPSDIRDRFRELEHIEVKEHGTLFSDVHEMLEQLTLDGHMLYICSNGSIEYIELVLCTTGIEKYFSKIYSAKHFSSKTKAIEEIIKDYKYAVVVGDTYSDIEAANLNNIPSIGVSYGYGKIDEISESTFTAQKPNDIINFIKQIEVFYFINQRLIDKGKKIIGISGVDTSGKTLFTESYSRFLNCIGVRNAILHIDDFHNPSAIRYQGDNEVDAYYNNAFNYNQLIDEILEPLQNTGCIDKNVLCLNLDTDKYENFIHYQIDKDMVLLIEGVLLFREPIINYLEGKVFLHISFEEVIERAKERDVPKYGKAFLDKYINKYIPIQKRFLLEHNPKLNSDIVINNEDYLNPKVKEI